MYMPSLFQSRRSVSVKVPMMDTAVPMHLKGGGVKTTRGSPLTTSPWSTCSLVSEPDSQPKGGGGVWHSCIQRAIMGYSLREDSLKVLRRLSRRPVLDE